MNIPAAIFKAECLKLMEDVARTGKPVVITKHGKPVAQLGPVPAGPESLFGYMRGTMVIAGDVLARTGEAWSAVGGEEDHLVAVAPRLQRQGSRRNK